MIKTLSGIKQIHMIGIKGTGMSALAVNLKQMGFRITGSDHNEGFFTDSLLKKHGLKAMMPFSATNLPPKTDLVVASTAYNSKTNRELAEAVKRGLKIMTYPEVLGLLTYQLPSVAVCGSHGKTTTSGIISYIFSASNYRPIVNVGSIVPQLINYKTTHPKLLVFEADEYQNKFQYFNPATVVLTNIDFDHPDFFKDPQHYQRVFSQFIKRIPKTGSLIYCADDKNAARCAKLAHSKVASYGFSPAADYTIKILEQRPTGMTFSVSRMGTFKTRLIGEHNARNLTAAIICAHQLKIPSKTTTTQVAKFTGTTRRLEVKRQTKINGFNCTIIDDFGHHPTEVKATISALKSAYPNKTLWVVFQPHTFSRTEALFDEFAGSFTLADKTIVLDIYASKRETNGKAHSRDLVKRMQKLDVKNANSYIYLPTTKEAADFIKQQINSESIILTLGASNVWELEKLI